MCVFLSACLCTMRMQEPTEVREELELLELRGIDRCKPICVF